MLWEGLVISHVGQGIAVEHDNQIILCQPLRKLETITVGDKVMWSSTAPEQGRIEAILPRRSLLTRPCRNNKTRPVAANIDTVYAVIAVEPEPDFLLVDQYLAVCENSNIAVALIVNKIDIEKAETIDKELLNYQNLGYSIIRTSTITGEGIEQLKSTLQQQTSLFAGQSGVGKSSLTSAIIPDKDIKTNTISKTTKHGRHTTTAATLYHMENGGMLIDSPGVSIFGLADLSRRDLASGFREFQPLMEKCQFNDCRHEKDKGCAVRKSAEEGTIAISRYERYLKLITKTHFS